MEIIVLNCGECTKLKYNFTSHNCHDFIQICMIEGCPESLLVKDGPCYTNKKTPLINKIFIFKKMNYM